MHKADNELVVAGIVASCPTMTGYSISQLSSSYLTAICITCLQLTQILCVYCCIVLRAYC